MFTPFLGQPKLMDVTKARADQVQTWVNRDHVKIEQPNPGRGKSRLYSELDAMKIGVMVRLAAFGIPVTEAAKYAAYVEDRYRNDRPMAWDEYAHISFNTQLNIPGHIVSSSAPNMGLNINSGDTDDLRVSSFSEWWPRHAYPRRAASGEIIPEARETLASAGIHAEPFLFFPLGEVVNGIRAQVARLRESI